MIGGSSRTGPSFYKLAKEGGEQSKGECQKKDVKRRGRTDINCLTSAPKGRGGRHKPLCSTFPFSVQKCV